MRSPNRLAPAVVVCTLVIACSSSKTPSPSGAPTPTSPSAPGPSNEANTVVSAIASRPELSTLASHVVAAGLDDDLATATAVTVFAPTNNAFARLAARTTPNNDDLAKILKYHVLGSKVVASEITAAGVSVPTLRTGPGRDNLPLSAQLLGTQVLIGGQAFVTVADIQTDNGVVHIIDSVLWAPDESLRYPGTIADVLADYPAFATLRAAVQNESLLGAFDGTGPCTSTARCTLFAPVQSAFAALGDTVTSLLGDGTLGTGVYASDLSKILRYHVVASEVPAAAAVQLKTARSFEGRYIGLKVNAGALQLSNVDMATPSTVIGTNFFTSNGVVHAINGVLVPPFRSLADLATGEGDAGFATLGAAAADTDAGLVPALSGSATSGANCSPAAPCTLLAPTNAAFARLVDALELADAAELLDVFGAGVQDVLLQHVAAGVADSAAVAAAGSLDTLFADDSARISVTAGQVFINTLTQVTGTDVIAANGILHTLDSVLYATSSTSPFPGSLLAAATAYPRLSSLTSSVSSNDGLRLFLNGGGECNNQGMNGANLCTLFAPTNEAFSAFTLGSRNLATVLSYHVVPGSRLEATDVVAQGTKLTAATDAYVGFRGGEQPTVGNVDVSANIVATDLFTTNGVIHVIDEVLYPAESTVLDVVANNPDFSTLEAAVTAANIVSYFDGTGSDCRVVQPCTVFAPNNASFARLVGALGLADANALITTLGDSLSTVLWSHVVGSWADYQAALDEPSTDTIAPSPLSIRTLTSGNSTRLFVNGTTEITSTDLVTKNGVIHVVDSVLVPTSSTAPFPGSIAAYLSAYPRLSSLLDAVVAQNLAPLFDGVDDNEVANECTSESRCTLFAPTNQAFSSADAAALAARVMSQVLSYHVLGNETDSSEIANNDSQVTLQGSNISFNKGPDLFSVDDSTPVAKDVTQADIFTENGIIHIIDGVLLYNIPG